ncbi:kainate selective glutamate receptor activity [Nesidiocoris tenuis]|uniref:Kainate selective glutamate receptor activity n=1 Tax=Nesidiocoris tenuis TaxID=355587 RepID=A0ABN7BCD1_9HEMI|nr:kainate selective glutamate receptor activity [Nesidiocoris tenuis]
MLKRFAFLCFLIHAVSSIPEVIKIGALFEEGDEWSKFAFDAAIKIINDDESTLPGIELQAETPAEPAAPFDIVGAERNVCNLMKAGVVGIVGPHSTEMTNHVQSLCDTMEIPHITARWHPRQRRSSCLVNLYPHPSILAKAAADIVLAWEWKGFTIVYDDYNALRKIGELVKIADDKGYTVSVRQLKGRDGEEDNYRYVLQEVKHSGEKNIVVEVARERLFDVMLQAQQVGLVGSGYSYIVTSLDFQSIDLEPFKWAGTNITGIRIVDPDLPHFKEVMKIINGLKNQEGGEADEEDKEGGGEGDEAKEEEEEESRRRKRRKVSQDRTPLKDDGEEEEVEEDADENEGNGDGEDEKGGDEEEGDKQENEGGEEAGGEEEGKDGEGEGEEPAEEEEEFEIPPVEALLIYDAVNLIAQALHNLDLIEPKEIDCRSQDAWESGYSVINFIKMSEQQGLSGLVKFDNEGFRSEVVLEIVELVQEGLRAKGNWTKQDGVVIHYVENDDGPVVAGDDLRNSTFIVLLALTHPYGMLKEDSRQLTGNDRFEGFGIDLIHELSMMSGFNYTFHVQEDKSSGSPKTLENGTRVWSGMIGEILAGRADLAIADMTITRERERDADFTMPFMNLGISILYRKPMKAPPSLFSFLSPFSYEVWGYILSAYLGVSFLLFIMARISPYEWTNPYPCIQEPTELETQFSLSNSLWFTTGSILQQGSDVAPISVSTRMVAAIWWFFTLIMVSSYTANLAAFLTIEQKIEPFTDVQGLANQDKVKYGAKKGGATANFFRDSKEPIYQKMWEFMEANPDVMMSTNEAGVDRVQYNTDYAFLMESASIEYEMERKCELMRVGDLLDNKGYGIAMRQNSSYRNVLSRNVIKLQEKGKLTQLKDKWWKEKRGGGACRATEEGGAASDLGLDNVGGVFVVLLGGCVLAVIISFGELLWDIYQRDDKVSFKDELIEEIKFIARCHGTVKPVRKGDASPSGSGKSGSKSSGNSRSQSPKTESRSRSRINHSRSRFSGRLLTDRLSLD